MKILLVFPEIWAKLWKMPYIATLKNPSKTFLDLDADNFRNLVVFIVV